MADFGYAGDGNADDESNSYRLAHQLVFSGTTNSTISGAYWRGKAASAGTATVYVGLYADSAGAPGALLVLLSASVSITTSAAWHEIAGTSAYALQNGTTYWIASASTYGSGWWSRYLNTSGTIAYAPGNALPDPWGSSEGTFTGQLCAYFTIAEPGGTTTYGKRFGGVLGVALGLSRGMGGRLIR